MPCPLEPLTRGCLCRASEGPGWRECGSRGDVCRQATGREGKGVQGRVMVEEGGVGGAGEVWDRDGVKEVMGWGDGALGRWAECG